MSHSEHQSFERPSVRVWPKVAGGLLLLAAAGGAIREVWQHADGSHVEEVRREDELKELEHAMQQFLQSEAAPMLAKTREKDLAAVKKAVDGIDVRFASYAAGIDNFASSLTGWGMRFKIMYRSGVETVERKDEHSWTAQLVRDKFHQHVVSDTRLEGDLNEVLRQFSYELESNRNEMLMDLHTKLKTSGLVVEMKDIRGFKENFQEKTGALLARLPGQSVTIGVGSITAGIVAEEAVRQLARAVLAQAAARLAAGATAAGTAGGATVAAGGVGGTAVAPGVGTAIGVIGGFVVGAAVDWWMTDEFEEKVSAQCRDYLAQTRTALITGESGLQRLLTLQVERTSAAAQAALEAAVQPDSGSAAQAKAGAVTETQAKSSRKS